MLEELYLINLIVFISGVVLFATLEYFFVFRKYQDKKTLRWGENFGLTLINTLIIRLLFIITPISAALYASENSIGIFHMFGVHEIVGGIIAFIVLDMVVYGEHVLFHKIPFLWRIHKVHHSDLDLDFSSGLRFHFLESILSVITKILVVVFLGAPIIAVVVFEIVLNFSAMFNHSNFILPKKIDTFVSKLIVTPKFHEVHHSQKLSESLSNYGFFLSIWDYLFGTYEKHEKKIEAIGLQKQKKRYSFKKLLLLKLDK
ncbi:sterol desaturase family protein [Candidatus Gracilibacteria bacterium]|nr:sterol desaturase family protein [Candidatus Gracilibacteria bacterium]